MVYGYALALCVKPRVFSPELFSQENLILAALRYSPLVNALAKVLMAVVVGIHCGLLRTTHRKRSTREKLLAATFGFAACLAATVGAMRFLK